MAGRVRWIFTLVAFVCIKWTVCQIGFWVVLSTFIGFFTIMWFQVSIQMARVRWCIMAMVAFDFVCIFSSVYFKVPVSEDVKSGWWYCFKFSPLCVFKCIFKVPVWEDVNSHWLHCFGFSALCVFNCIPKVPVLEDVKSAWLFCFRFTPLHCIVCFQMHLKSACIREYKVALVALVWNFSIFSNAPRKSLYNRMNFLHCVISNAPPKCLNQMI